MLEGELGGKPAVDGAREVNTEFISARQHPTGLA